MILVRKIATAIATGALVFNAFASSAFAATTIEISGNGTDSENEAEVSVTRDTTVVQSNKADVKNDVDVDADTGNNDANDNTGGDVSIETGSVDTEVDVSNTLNSNTASVNCCPNGDTEVLISGNGSKSDNSVELSQESSIDVFQNNQADVDNDVDVDADTGGNDAEDNTGGDVSITTGDIDTSVSLETTGNVNSAKIGGNNGDGSSLSARIIGNGTDSENEIELVLLDGILLVQSNKADVDNDVDVDADTGDNDANDNTDGDVTIETGDVDTDVDVDNMVNFNFADADCGCLLDDVLAKISGNGSDSDNSIEAELEESLEVFQDNCGDGPQGWGEWWPRKDDCELDNDVDVDADTGGNDAEDNTGGVNGGDPNIDTGDADADVELNNSGNVNVYGVGTNGPEIPDFDFNLVFSFNLNDLLDWLMNQP